MGATRLVCVAAPMLHARRIGRVIARPFTGTPGAYRRTVNRHDYAIAPPGPTLLDQAKAAGCATYGIGKISDIFAGRSVDQSCTGADADLMRSLADHARDAADGSLTFANFVEFASLYGHRRDVPGYARALEEFDTDLVALERELRDGDLVILAADHGNDPTHTVGTDHTREHVPVIAWRVGADTGGESLGTRKSFADIGATVEAAFGLVPPVGESFLAAV